MKAKDRSIKTSGNHTRQMLARSSALLLGLYFGATCELVLAGPEGGEVVRGHDAIRKTDGPLFQDPTIRLEWDPKVAGVFGRGDQGFTRGRYRLVRRPESGDPTTLGEGTYLSIWTKVDGVWKAIVDAGSTIKKPEA